MREQARDTTDMKTYRVFCAVTDEDDSVDEGGDLQIRYLCHTRHAGSGECVESKFSFIATIL